MALVAYSDESDISDEDEETSQVPFLKASPNVSIKPNLNSNSISNKIFSTPSGSTNSISSISPSGIESIIDEDEDFIQMTNSTHVSSNQDLLTSLQAVARTSAPVNISNLTLDVGEDELTDVPTKETWKVSQDVLKKMAEKSEGSEYSHPDATARNTKSPAIISPTRSIEIGSNSDKSKDGDGVPLAHTLGKAQQIALASSALGSLIQKKKILGRKVQLLLPALSELMEEDDDALVVDQSVPVVPRKAAPSKAGTGLFSLLPKPKYLVKGKEANRSLVPHNLFKKPQPPGPLRPNASLASRSQGTTHKHKGGTKNTSGKNSQVKSSNLGSLGLLSGEEDDSEDDNDDEVTGGSVDFFSLDAQDRHRLPPPGTFLAAVAENDDSMIVNEVAEPAIVSPVNINNRILNDKQSVLSSATISTASFGSSLDVNTVQGTTSSSSVYDDDRPNEPYCGGGEQEDFIPMTSSSGVGSSTEMDDEAWRRLSGKKRKAEVIDIIEVNADDALLPREEWMNRAATQEKPSHSHSKKKGNLPSQQQKRKHQITYLAHQAKEREIELKNDWSAGKVKKQQTRAKYGF